MTKRLFIFASYDKDGIIDPTLLHYLNALSELGDIVFTMDNDISDAELSKVTAIHNVLHATATRHGEYDFGSYKRGYIWAHDNKILEKYDWVYLVNDSVYGPLWNITPILIDLESRNVDLIGMVDMKNSHVPQHVQSWFVGITSSVAKDKNFYSFLTNVKKQPSKELIILKYEVGLSQVVLQQGYKMSTLINDEIRHKLYEKPLLILTKGLPFIKKAAINRVHFQYLCPYTEEALIKSIQKNFIRTRNNTKIIPLCPYIKTYRFALLGIPLLSIYERTEQDSKIHMYKICLFNKLPIMKLSRTLQDTTLKKKAE